MMFQIAAGYSLALDLNVDFAYTYDAWGSSTPYDISLYPTSIFKRLKKVSLRNLKGNIRRYSEPRFEYDRLPLVDNLILDGYFQSSKYFNHNLHVIRDLFCLKEKDDYHDYTFLHVRRKDYLKYSDIHPTCELQYYENCLRQISPKKCVILSDDISWCRDNFTDNIFEFSTSEDPLHDLSVMKSCKNAIISNSSFSWWGATLAKNIQMVFAPLKWFGPKGHKNWNDIYCNSWKIL